MAKRDVTLAQSMGKKIRSFREKRFKGWGGQEKCAELYGATANKWSKWENGHTIPTDAEQRKLASFFGITVSELRGEITPATAAGVTGGDVDTMNVISQLSKSIARMSALVPLLVQGRIDARATQHVVDSMNTLLETLEPPSSAVSPTDSEGIAG